jgi:hypothetical protein
MPFERWLQGRKARLIVVGLVLFVAAGGVVALMDARGGRTAQTAQRAEGRLAAPTTSGGKALPGAVAADNALRATTEDVAGGAGSVANVSGAAPSPSFAAPGGDGSKVIKTATLRVKVGKGRFASAFDQAAAVAARYHGFVASSSTATADRSAAEGTLTIRVPADTFDAARRDLGGLGRIERQELGGQDVSGQLVDYDARIRSLQGQEQALSAIMGRARTVGEVIEVQGQLFAVRQQIEQLQAERANLAGQASMATLTVTFFEPGAAVAHAPDEPATGLARSWHRALHGSVAVIGGMVVLLGYLLPLALLGLLGWGVWRLGARRRRPVPNAAV